jgi:hypothetical protein
MKYVKKPIVVEAFQFGVDDTPEWFNEDVAIFKIDGEGGFIKSPSAKLIAFQKGEFITNINGVIYPCKEEIFKATYELESMADGTCEPERH